MIKEEDINLFKKYETAPEQAFGGRVHPQNFKFNSSKIFMI